MVVKPLLHNPFHQLILYLFIFQNTQNCSLTILDVKECPGGVAVGCFTYRITDRM